MRKASGGLGRRCQGHGGGGRFEDKLKKIWHRWCWQLVWLDSVMSRLRKLLEKNATLLMLDDDLLWCKRRRHELKREEDNAVKVV